MDAGVKIEYPEALPVSRHREDIADALRDHRVVIVCGDTGSGKTTQLPKIALERVPDAHGMVGCTQPRRIAATSVAKRVAGEMGVELGEEVGYQIRFQDRSSRDRTRIKFMTDGILLAETRGDPLLRRYGTVIVDEAHERSLNIDFLLGYLHRLLKKRRDFRVIVSSATLDAERFAEFFDGAPVVSVEGRMFPVEDRYQPPEHRREPLAEQVLRAVEDLGKEDRFGDTLVFLPGEREIREAAELLEGHRLPDTRVLPLYARLAGKDQDAVFRPVRTARRVILATNVAETSLTIPGIRFVVDTGLARVSRFDPRSGIQRLQVEEVSRASARQRRGRCGRVSEGICVRLCEEEEFEERPDYTDPEILRSNLAGVVLQMEHLGLGDPLEFPFVDPPQPKRVAQAYRTLEEIGAMEGKGGKSGRKSESGGLTEIGKVLARLPLDPRVGRVLVAAREEGCLEEALVVVSALAVQDPRERPREKQEAADQAHARFQDPRSDFTGWLRWWFAIGKARAKSGNELRRFCRKNFLNHRRAQEWMNLHRELRGVLREMRWKLPGKKKLSDPEDSYSEPLHRAVLAGIPSHIGCHDGKKKGYRGAKNTRFHLFPGSGVFGSSPAWVMAFERVETAKLYARNAALFDPAWMEKVAPHLCRYRYTNPQWHPEQGNVTVEESVLAFGLPLVQGRRIQYARVNPARAREIFLQEALVEGNTRAPLAALARNRETLAAAERLEHKLRRRGGLVHMPSIEAFYEEKLPPDICGQKAFERWAAALPEGALDFSLEDCLATAGQGIAVEDFPDRIPMPDLEDPEGEGIDGEAGPGVERTPGGQAFSLTYLHDPGEKGDGITVRVPLAELPWLPEWFGDWLVPGWLPEKVGALLRCAGKDLRRLLPSLRETVEAFLDAWEGYEPRCGLLEAVVDFLQEEYGIEARAAAFDLDRMPPHLRMRYEVVDDSGKALGAGRGLAALREKYAGDVAERFDRIARKKFRRERLADWSFGDLPGEVALDRRTTGWPGLFLERREVGGEVGLSLWPAPECAARQHAAGAARLFRLAAPRAFQRLEIAWFESGAKGGSRQRVSTVAAKGAGAGKMGKGGAGAEGFGSLAAAFGETAAGASRKQQASAGGQANKGPTKSTGAATGGANDEMTSFTPGEVLLLREIGTDPARNRDDFLDLVAREALREAVPGSAGGDVGSGRSEQRAAAGGLHDPLARLRREEDWRTAVADAESSLIPVARSLGSTLSKILEVADRIGNLLGSGESGYEESLEDAREHFAQIFPPGWILRGDLRARLLDLEGLELRLTRMFGSPPAKDLGKLERFRAAAAEIWSDLPECPCGRCFPPPAEEAARAGEADLRLREFAPELRSRR